MISGHGNIETAVNAIKRGAFDFIEKPFKADRLLVTLERALENARLRRENEELRARVGGQTELIGHSAAMTQLRQAIERVAPTGSRVSSARGQRRKWPPACCTANRSGRITDPCLNRTMHPTAWKSSCSTERNGDGESAPRSGS
jgi:two-component system nitrogen regulation response regulator NtrX